MDNDLKLFDYSFVDNKAESTLFLLHGTGGDKTDFLFLNKPLGGKYNLVGLQGNINENGMSRFFKRSAVGLFDQQSIREETEKLHNFIKAWIEKQKTKYTQLFFLGYSNGANILLAALFHYPQIFTNLILLHPMIPFQIHEGSLNLFQHRIFISMGVYDQIVSMKEQVSVIKVLNSCHAKPEVGNYQSGHEISNSEIEDVVIFLKEGRSGAK